MEINKDEVGIIAGIFAILVTLCGWLWKGREVVGKVEEHDEDIEELKREYKDLKKEVNGIRNSLDVLTENVKGIVGTTDLKLERLNDSIMNMGAQFKDYHAINNDTLKALHISNENVNKDVKALSQTVVRMESVLNGLKKS